MQMVGSEVDKKKKDRRDDMREDEILRDRKTNIV